MLTNRLQKLAAAGCLLSTAFFAPAVTAAAAEERPEAHTVNVPFPSGPHDYSYAFEKEAKLLDIASKLLEHKTEKSHLVYQLKPAGDGKVVIEINLEGGSKDVAIKGTSTVDSKGGLLKDVQHTASGEEVTDVTVKEVQFMGKNKVITWNKIDPKDAKEDKPKKKSDDDDNGKECMVDPSDIVTTLFELPVWAATIGEPLPPKGVSFRLCLQGSPVQMKLAQESADDKTVTYVCQKVASKNDQNGEAHPAIKLTFDKKERESGFAMPLKIFIQAGPIAMHLSRHDHQE